MLYLVTALFFLTFAYAFTDEPVLIQYAPNVEVLPHQFRTCQDPYQKSGDATRKGLDALKLSGSGQFSQLGLTAILKHLSSRPFFIIDLRQEYHGYLNGVAVSWFVTRDWINLGKADSEIAIQEKQLLHQLQEMKNVEVSRVQRKSVEGGILQSSQELFQVKSIMSEQEVAEAAKVGYLRLYVTDHMAPTAEEVNRFLTFYRALPPNAWLHFHCAGGDGRTTTFMAMVDMLHNAKDVSFEEILSRQYLLGGINLANLGDPEAWKSSHARHRMEFLKSFYAYARTNKDGLWQKF